jgi:hypothetical protein
VPGSNKRRVAKKEHRCEECRRAILPGATYHHITGLFDGSWWSAKLCARCQRAWDRANDRGAMVGTHPEDGPSFGDLAEWLREWRRDGRVWLNGRWSTPIEAVRARRDRRRSLAGHRAAVEASRG